jgi:hypothetical protein
MFSSNLLFRKMFVVVRQWMVVVVFHPQFVVSLVALERQEFRLLVLLVQLLEQRPAEHRSDRDQRTRQLAVPLVELQIEDTLRPQYQVGFARDRKHSYDRSSN